MGIRATKKILLTVLSNFIKKIFFFLLALSIGEGFSVTTFASPLSIPSTTLSRFEGTGIGNHLAEYQRVGIGDFNGDGDQDIILVSGGFGGQGRIYVYFGGSPFSGTISLPVDASLGSADLSVWGTSSSNTLGGNLQILDTNEDGFDDIIVTQLGYPDKLHIIFGDASWTNSNFNDVFTNIPSGLLTTITHTQANTYQYLHILGAIDGDVNGDSVIDNRDKHLAVCSSGSNNGTCLLMPVANVLSGGTFQSTSTHYVSAVDPSVSISSGDFNNDGTSDLVFGNPDALYSHSVTIIYGPISGSDSRLVSELDPSSYLYTISNYFQAGVVGSDGTNEDIVIWDVNSPFSSSFGELVTTGKLFGSDYDDLIIGSAHETCDPGVVEAGRFHLISGESLEALRSSVSGTDTGIEIYSDTSTGTYNYSNVDVVLFGGDQNYAKFGGAGSAEVNIDLNGDGQKDLIAGGAAYTADPANPQFKGIVHIVYGGDLDTLIGGEYALGATSPYSAEYLQGNTNHGVGTDIVAGDYTGDGIDDAIILAAGAGPGGTAYLLPGEPTDEDGDGFLSATDPDGDGIFTTYDCNDKDANLFPETFYADVDGDGFGALSNTIEACGEVPTGYVADTNDCDDTNPNINTSVAEICDGVDNNCSGTVDEGLTLNTYYADTDNDGFGDPATSLGACALTPPDGYVADATDCNDSTASISPSASETCDAIDNNCSGTVDEGLTLNTYYADTDNDGFGDTGNTTSVCATTAPTGYLAMAGDCNDSSANISPSASETCDSIDNNCNGTADEGLTTTYYLDNDGDGVGGTTSQQACSGAANYVLATGDCNDSSNAIYPGATELCDSVDNDCDGTVDNGITYVNYYPDVDGDSFGDANASPVQQCLSPGAGYSINNLDCNDTLASVNPNATETCGDSLDNNCDGAVNEDSATDTVTWYYDSDNDGVGDASQTVTSCTAPADYVATAGDCDDNDVLNNCNDNDADTYTVAAGDCDDTNVAVYPGATEVGDGFDNDCDGKFDENLMKVKINSPVGTVDAGDNLALNIFYLNSTGFQNFNVQVYILKNSYQSPNGTVKKGTGPFLRDNKKGSPVVMLNPWYRACGTNNQNCTLIGSATSQNLSNDELTHSFSLPVNLPNNLNSGETYGLFVKIVNPQTTQTQFTITAYNDTVRNNLTNTSSDPWYNDAVDLLAMVE